MDVKPSIGKAGCCRFSFNDSLEFPYGPFGKIMGWVGERMAKKSSQEILQNLKRLAEASSEAAEA